MWTSHPNCRGRGPYPLPHKGTGPSLLERSPVNTRGFCLASDSLPHPRVRANFKNLRFYTQTILYLLTPPCMDKPQFRPLPCNFPPSHVPHFVGMVWLSPPTTPTDPTPNQQVPRHVRPGFNCGGAKRISTMAVPTRDQKPLHQKNLLPIRGGARLYYVVSAQAGGW